MNICPVCANKNQNAVCPTCGFDASCDYESYPTLSKVNSFALTMSGIKNTYKNSLKKYLSCKKCGGKTFYIDGETNAVLCSNCLEPMEIFCQNKSLPQKEEQKETTKYTVQEAVKEAGRLVNLCPNQSDEEKRKTVSKLKALFDSFSFNSDLGVMYAAGLSCIIQSQSIKEKEQTVFELERLYKRFKYHSEIAKKYAMGLSLLSVTQDYSDKQDTVKSLKALYSHFNEYEEFALFYAQGLRNLSRDQNIRERQTTLLEIKGLYEAFKDSEAIAEIYAMTIYNICKYQGKTDLKIYSGRLLGSVVLDSKLVFETLRKNFPQNRSIRQYDEEISKMSRR